MLSSWVDEMSPAMLFIAAAAPVLVLFNRYNVVKLKTITSIFIVPSIIKNDFLDCGTISEDIVAACPEPIPGRNEHKGDEIIDPIIDLK